MIKRKKGKKPHKPKVKSITKLMKEADRLFSLIVRQTGEEKCYTCGHKNEWKKLHCGHYLSRFYKAARWDFDNARPQCMMCNLWKKGDTVVFRQNLVKEIGIDRVLAVEAKRNVSFKLTREYLTALSTALQNGLTKVKSV